MARLVGALVDRADEIVLLADASKFDARARHLSLPFERVGTLITDDRIRDDQLAAARAKGVKVIVAKGASA